MVLNFGIASVGIGVYVLSMNNNIANVSGPWWTNCSRVNNEKWTYCKLTVMIPWKWRAPAKALLTRAMNDNKLLFSYSPWNLEYNWQLMGVWSNASLADISSVSQILQTLSPMTVRVWNLYMNKQLDLRWTWWSAPKNSVPKKHPQLRNVYPFTHGRSIPTTTFSFCLAGLIFGADLALSHKNLWTSYTPIFSPSQ